jgi:hypothetical protein
VKGVVEGREEWRRSGWRNRGVEGRVKGVVEKELVGEMVEWRGERSSGGEDGEADDYRE